MELPIVIRVNGKNCGLGCFVDGNESRCRLFKEDLELAEGKGYEFKRCETCLLMEE